MPKIVATEKGFISQIENAEVQYLECDFKNKKCTVFFHRKAPKELHIECSSFNRQYGIPVSDDGSRLFFSDWDNGLWAYNLESGNIDWYSPSKHVTYLIVDSGHLIAVQQNRALLCFDIETGAIEKEVKSRSIQDAFMIDRKNLLVDSISGRLCAVSLPDLSIFKRYSDKIVNPHRCLSVLIQQIEFRDNMLSIKGVEEYPNHIMVQGQEKYFTRIIDSNFKERNGDGSSGLAEAKRCDDISQNSDVDK